MLTTFRGCIFLFVLMVFVGCQEAAKPIKYSDPYLDAFRGKGIKYMVSIDRENPDLADTLVFDSIGNITMIKSKSSWQRMGYDSLNFITRSLLMNDNPSNYSIDYSLDKNFLVQKWNQIEHLKWDFSKADINEISRVIYFELNGEGRIVQEADSTSNQVIIYKYDATGALDSEEVFTISPRELLHTWKYLYRKPFELEMVKLIKGSDQESEIYYYREGLLDSSSYPIEGYTKSYKYFY